MRTITEADIDNCRNILNAISNPIIILDLDKNIKFMNESAKNLVKLPYEECLNHSCECFCTPYCGTINCCVERFLRGDTDMIQHGQNNIANRISISYLYNDKQTPIGYISISTDVRELLKTQKELIINQERIKIALRQTKSLLFRYDPYEKSLSRIDTSNDLSFQILPSFDVLHSIPEYLWEHKLLAQDSIADVLNMCDQIKSGQIECECNVKLRTMDQQYRWFNIQSTSILDKDGSVIEAIGILKDITEEKEMKLDYQNKKEYYDIVSSEYIAVYETDLTTGEIVSVHQRSSNDFILLDCDYDEMNQNMRSFLHPDDMFVVEEKERSALIKRFQNGESQFSCEYRRLVNRCYQWTRSTMDFVENHNGHITARVYLKNRLNLKIGMIVINS